MNAVSEPRYLLSWKGRQTGPFDLASIRAQLVAGEISRVHQIQIEGRWLLLDEHLAREEKQEQAERHRDLPRAEDGFETRGPLSALLPRSLPPATDDPPDSFVRPVRLSPPIPEILLADQPPREAPLAALAGSVLLLCGAVSPIISVPVIGGIAFWRTGWPCYLTIGLALASIVLTLTGRLKALWLTGGATVLVLAGWVTLVSVQLGGLRKSAPGDLGDLIGNAVLASIQPGWGCIVLISGVALLFAGAFLAGSAPVARYTS